MIKQAFIFLLLLSLSITLQANTERLLFDLKFSFAKGGEAVLTIEDTVFNGKPAIKYSMVGRTTGLTDKLFGVNDAYETIVDAETRLPLKSIRNIKENKYRWYNETLYYRDIDSINSQKSGWRAVPHDLVDIISVFFYFINKHLIDDIDRGQSVTLPTFHADKIENVTIKFMGEKKVETELGKINAYVLAPIVDKGKLLKRSDGLRFYISKDRKVPILIEFDMKLGTLKVELRSYKINNVEQITN
jgi:hypothetical protein